MQRFLRAFTLLGAALGASCSDPGPTDPRSASLRTIVYVTGVGLDERGFSIVVNSQVVRNVSADTSVTITSVISGTYLVTLTRIGDDCTIAGSPSRTVSVALGDVADITFDVTCTGTGIAVSTHTTGADIVGSYRIVIDDAVTIPIGVNDAVRSGKLLPGRHTVLLALPSDRCVPTGPREVTLDLVASRLTPIEFTVSCSRISPTSKIAYANDTTARGTPGRWITVMNADGSGSHVLELGDAPSWSPDGQTLAYSDASCAGLALSSSCGGGLFMVDPETWSTRYYSLFGYAVRDLAWNPSPTGASLAAVLCCDTGTSRLGMIDYGDLWTWAVPIQEVERVRFPSWSPDGSQLAFSCTFARSGNEPDTGWDLCQADMKTGQVKHLTNDRGDELHPRWSPDGTRIAFTRGSDIAILPGDGQSVTTLTPGSEPAWSPDGKRLVFVGENGLFSINADGSNRRRLTSGTHHSPTWRP